MVIGNRLKKSGFTLTEVLITLAIIGVISALSVPALIRNTNDEKLVALYRKAYGMANQAILGAGDDSAPVMLVPKTETTEQGVSSTTIGKIHLRNFEAFRSQFKRIQDCSGDIRAGGCWAADATQVIWGAPSSHADERAFISSDGMYWALQVEGAGFGAPGAIKSGVIVDTNGAKGPNKVGKDIFPFWYLPPVPTSGTLAGNLGTAAITGPIVRVQPGPECTSATNCEGWTGTSVTGFCPETPCFYKSWLSGGN